MKMQDFISELAGTLDVKKSEAERVFKNVLESIFKAVESDGSLRTSYGTFSLKETSARKGRNPQTGEAIDIPAKKKISFTMSSTYKKDLNA